jgi:formate transporter
MSYYKPEEIAEETIKYGVKKVNYPFRKSLILGFQAGAFIALGYLLYIRVTAPLGGELEGISTILGASVFPIGLILTLIAGGELLTGNMMAVPLARLAREIEVKQVVYNLGLITISNFLGAVFIAYFFGHVTGLTETGIYLDKMVHIAEHKIEGTFLQAFISGIGCNWLVALAVWLNYGTDNIPGKILGIWFPTMTFVAIGFQHVVANMFVIPAAIFAGHLSWLDFIGNFVPVFFGNLVGGSIFVATLYWHALSPKKEQDLQDKKQSLKVG